MEQKGGGMTDKDPKTSLEKALDVLEAVGAGRNVGLHALTQATGYPPSTVHRLLKILGRRRYVRQDPATSKYQLSLKVLELASLLREGMGVIEVARPVMKSLMEATGETVNLVVFEGNEAVYVEQVANPQSLLRMFTRVGARTPLYCSGVGKAFLAAQSDDRALGYFQAQEKVRHTPRTILNSEGFIQELERTRERGYALDNEEMETGVGCVAAVIASNGNVLAGLSISGPASRILADGGERMGQAVRAAAVEISQKASFLSGASAGF